jgi:hypothetical protein
MNPRSEQSEWGTGGVAADGGQVHLRSAQGRYRAIQRRPHAGLGLYRAFEKGVQASGARMQAVGAGMSRVGKVLTTFVSLGNYPLAGSTGGWGK